VVGGKVNCVSPALGGLARENSELTIPMNAKRTVSGNTRDKGFIIGCDRNINLLKQGINISIKSIRNSVALAPKWILEAG
jgi:hypothetical protein